VNSKILDCSDIDQYLGKAITSSRLRDPIANNDIRRWAHAMHFPNPVHYDPTFAQESRWRLNVSAARRLHPTPTQHGARSTHYCGTSLRLK
jgi:hypothetical protein